VNELVDQHIDQIARKMLPTIQRIVIDGMNRPAIACELNATVI
jgi:hypothetical protein